MILALSVAIESPSPVISVVMPWKIFEGRCGLIRIVVSYGPSISMDPGATTIPCASMMRFAVASASRPIAAILPARIPISAAYQGEPVPSTMCPLRMTRSYGWAKAAEARRKRRMRMESRANSGAGELGRQVIEPNALLERFRNLGAANTRPALHRLRSRYSILDQHAGCDHARSAEPLPAMYEH